MIGLLKNSDFNGRLHSLQCPQDKEALYEHFYYRHTVGTNIYGCIGFGQKDK